MVIVDTSVWVSHLRHGNSRLQKLLQAGRVASHPFIIGELACGNISNRTEIISLMQALPMLDVVEHEELLLAGIPLWTQDKKLKQACSRLSIDFSTH